MLNIEEIRENPQDQDWTHISKYQTLSEDFIREFKDKVDWIYISIHQTLSEDFIREFKDLVNWINISGSQTLSEDFIREFKIKKPENSWLYSSKEEKLKYIKENTSYKIIDDTYILAYKSVRRNNTSVFKPGMVYEIGKTYEAHCDYNLKEENSFGLSAWTKEKALEYHSKGNLLKVKIMIEDVGAIVHYNEKIRCKKLTVVDRI